MQTHVQPTRHERSLTYALHKVTLHTATLVVAVESRLRVLVELFSKRQAAGLGSCALGLATLLTIAAYFEAAPTVRVIGNNSKIKVLQCSAYSTRLP